MGEALLGSPIGLKEAEIGAALANCRALINQINAGLSAEKPFLNISSAPGLLFILSLPLLLSKSPHQPAKAWGAEARVHYH
jgi:hypothetical protein